mgnify:CR=1 FL=1
MIPLIPLNTSRNGEQITDIKTIVELASKQKCVIYRGARVPAAFIQNFQARHLQNEIEQKVIFHYKKTI